MSFLIHVMACKTSTICNDKSKRYSSVFHDFIKNCFNIKLINFITILLYTYFYFIIIFIPNKIFCNCKKEICENSLKAFSMIESLQGYFSLRNTQNELRNIRRVHGKLLFPLKFLVHQNNVFVFDCICPA